MLKFSRTEVWLMVGSRFRLPVSQGNWKLHAKWAIIGLVNAKHE